MNTTPSNPPPETSPAILIVGAGGLLGSALSRAWQGRLPFTAWPRAALDLQDDQAVRAGLARLRPALVVNTSAWSDVDGAEDHEDAAMAINHRVPATLARACTDAGASLIHFSTDFVFDGARREPYLESDTTAPLGAYGRSKLAGEQAVLQDPGAHLVLRVCWLYGPGGRNFFSQVGQWLQQDRELRVVADQVSVPNNVDVLAQVLGLMLQQALAGGPDWLQQRRGLYHLSATGPASRYDYACAVRERLGAQARARLLPVPASDFVMKAQRPAWSVLDTSRWQRVFGLPVGAWQDGLAR